MTRIILEFNGIQKTISLSKPSFAALRTFAARKFSLSVNSVRLTSNFEILTNLNFPDLFSDGLSVIVEGEEIICNDNASVECTCVSTVSAPIYLPSPEIPDDLRACPNIDEYQVFSLSNLNNSTTRQIIDAIRKHGFVLLETDEAAEVSLENLFEYSRQFFHNTPLDRKLLLKDPDFRYIGYEDRSVLNKELFMVRNPMSLYADNSMEIIYQTCYNMLEGMALDLVEHLLDHLGFPSVDCSSILNQTIPATGYSMTNMTIFHYNEGCVVHCPQHTDIGLFTIIRHHLSAGLSVFDWDLGKWVQVEQMIGSNRKIVVGLVGESMQRLTSNYLLATVHEVAEIKRERYSTALQLLAHCDSVLDSTLMDLSKNNLINSG